MSIVPINIGSASNDGNGQDLRSGGQVINANFAELDQRTTAAQSAADAAQAKADAAIPTVALGESVPQLINGTVPASQLPSFVDDVLEFPTLADFPATGDTGKIYIAVNDGDSPSNPTRQYRWSGSAFVLIPSSPGSTDQVPEGSINQYFTQPRVRSTTLPGLDVLINSAIVATDTVLIALGKLQAQVTSKFSNPMTTIGDIIIGMASGVAQRLSIGSAGQVLTVSGGAPVWANPKDSLSPLSSSEISVTGAATLTAGRAHVCSAGNYTVTLPAAASSSNTFLSIRVAGGNGVITIKGNGSDTIDGKNTRQSWAYESCALFCDGSAWTKVAGKSIPMTCEMYPATEQVVAHNTVVKVPLNLAVLDNTSQMADAATNYRINIKRSAIYHIHAVICYQPGTQVMSMSQCRIHVNGTLAALGADIAFLDVPAAKAFYLQQVVELSLNAGDYVELYTFQQSASSVSRNLYVNNISYCYLSVYEKVDW